MDLHRWFQGVWFWETLVEQLIHRVTQAASSELGKTDFFFFPLFLPFFFLSFLNTSQAGRDLNKEGNQ